MFESEDIVTEITGDDVVEGSMVEGEMVEDKMKSIKELTPDEETLKDYFFEIFYRKEPECPSCTKAFNLLGEYSNGIRTLDVGYPHPVVGDLTNKDLLLSRQEGVGKEFKTIPQIWYGPYNNQEYIGGFEDLVKFIEDFPHLLLKQEEHILAEDDLLENNP